MKITPVLTEKSLALVKDGFYTFAVNRGYTKGEIRKAIETIFKVHVKAIKTANYKGGTKKNLRGKKVSIAGFKKARVSLKDDEKIGLFEEKSK